MSSGITLQRRSQLLKTVQEIAHGTLLRTPVEYIQLCFANSLREQKKLHSREGGLLMG